ncbi:16S rRNA (guanine(527)-N(7))-methyltransferase RsmG [Polymorphobacter sp.]|uniref:16S rRNA (guanine(527)-N(7))-methyltransferase RsmG n=1 Tax=Polymorphobacter sp. TaxID=1909290 RepID=UPI003F6EF890
MIDRTTFAALFNVPRETLEKLDLYAALLIEWQEQMNLVGPATLDHIWDRHFADSAQLLDLAPKGAFWLDLGAGAGFPGLVIALSDPSARVKLVESIAKKCRFLEEVSRRLGLEAQVEVVNARIEHVPPQQADIITARALAQLSQLFTWGLPHASAETLWLLPKGARHAEEIEAAERRYRFQHTLIASRTSDEARIVRATGVARK